MTQIINSTAEVHNNIKATVFLKQRIMKAVDSIAKFHLECPDSPHIRFYVDPITGRVVPVQDQNLKS